MAQHIVKDPGSYCPSTMRSDSISFAHPWAVLMVLRCNSRSECHIQTRQQQGEDMTSVPTCLLGVKKVEDPQRLLSMYVYMYV